MSDHDDLLRRVLADEAAGVDPQPDWDDVRRRADRRRPAWLPAAAVLLVVAAAVGAGFLVRDTGEEDAGVVADDPTTTTSTTDATSTTTTTPDPTTTVVPSTVPAPRWAIAAGADAPSPLQDAPRGEPLGDDEVVAAIDVPSDDEFPAIDVAVLSKATGEVVRTLATGYDTVEGGVYGLTLSPDRRSVFWVVATSACTSRIEVAPVDGSGPAVAFRDDADRIAFGPDGSFAIEVGDVCVSPATIEVGDSAGGPTTVYTAPDGRTTTVESMALTGDHLAVVPSTSDVGSTGALHVIDRSSGEVAAVPAQDSRAFSGVHTGDDGRFVALEGCCGRQPFESADLVWFDAAEVVERRPIEVEARPYSASIDPAGDLLVIAGGEIGDLHVDDRLVRTDVYVIAN